MAPKFAAVPAWIPLWLVLSGVLMLYDAGYCLLRPRSLPGGDLFYVWRPYTAYAKVDKLYSREALLAGDGFCAGQSYLNLAELSLQFYAVHVWRHSPNPQHGDLIAFSTQLMTLWKTILYQLNDLLRPAGQRYTEGSPTWEWLLVFVLPTMWWIICPTAIVYIMGVRIANALPKPTKGKKM